MRGLFLESKSSPVEESIRYISLISFQPSLVHIVNPSPFVYLHYSVGCSTPFSLWCRHVVRTVFVRSYRPGAACEIPRLEGSFFGITQRCQALESRSSSRTYVRGFLRPSLCSVLHLVPFFTLIVALLSKKSAPTIGGVERGRSPLPFIPFRPHPLARHIFFMCASQLAGFPVSALPFAVVYMSCLPPSLLSPSGLLLLWMSLCGKRVERLRG